MRVLALLVLLATISVASPVPGDVNSIEQRTVTFHKRGCSFTTCTPGGCTTENIEDDEVCRLNGK
jgi:hypothetical protein